MSDKRTPIEIMIDQACRVIDIEAAPAMVTLRCPECHRTLRVRKDPSDPPRTVIVQARCPECVGGDFDEVLYFDKAGKQLSCP